MKYKKICWKQETTQSMQSIDVTGNINLIQKADTANEPMRRQKATCQERGNKFVYYLFYFWY